MQRNSHLHQWYRDHRLLVSKQRTHQLNQLYKRVQCDFSSPTMKATGLPPHTKILAWLKEVEESRQ
jgi:hypothetical protein